MRLNPKILAILRIPIAKKAKPYLIQHVTGRLSVVSGAQWSVHVQAKNLIRIGARRALVRPDLSCWKANDGALVFRPRELNFSGDTPIANNWAAVIRAWLRKGPFPEMMDLDYLMREGKTNVEASAQLRGA